VKRLVGQYQSKFKMAFWGEFKKLRHEDGIFKGFGGKRLNPPQNYHL
jgi:hypothetical protein